ncbi:MULTISPECIES: metallophosphoesterase [unclassified Pseudodesulfovibrio]|uniref:metallophosphoesterase family protein n=1 Tax=unclassified Pseudodesulfovibrio TaxID=2661612 RepID=UPI000FEB89BB|nr:MULTISPECIES: metallophosphoesterase [unclassified Pseudodesulfovibrio]MCJ2166054.1 metallophosphoesterase [Pseudodesulfovibrio sp. S3-i]RWU02499.1 serine/threonine protein phosphatase [Pseudodesulfovibrio sp. S3]
MYWIAFGDIHESIDLLDSIPGLDDADGVIITGDITNRGSREAANRVIEAVARINPCIMAQPGNMDTDVVQAYLQEKHMDIHLQVRELAPGLGLMGVGLSTPTPFATPNEISEEMLGSLLEETYILAEAFDTLICVIHEPPIDTAVDRLSNGQHVGSPAVRAFIERVQPAVAITGHIHESTGTDMLGNTPVINPGMLAGGGYVRIDFDGHTVTATLESV